MTMTGITSIIYLSRVYSNISNNESILSYVAFSIVLFMYTNVVLRVVFYVIETSLQASCVFIIRNENNRIS